MSKRVYLTSGYDESDDSDYVESSDELDPSTDSIEESQRVDASETLMSSDGAEFSDPEEEEDDEEDEYEEESSEEVDEKLESYCRHMASSILFDMREDGWIDYKKEKKLLPELVEIFYDMLQ